MTSFHSRFTVVSQSFHSRFTVVSQSFRNSPFPNKAVSVSEQLIEAVISCIMEKQLSLCEGTGVS